jgi:hypothetical protein
VIGLVVSGAGVASTFHAKLAVPPGETAAVNVTGSPVVGADWLAASVTFASAAGAKAALINALTKIPNSANRRGDFRPDPTTVTLLEFAPGSERQCSPPTT